MKKVCGILLIVGFLHAGWIIKFKEEGKGIPPETTTTYISKGIVLHQSKDVVFILDFKKELIRIISHKDKSYYEGTVDEFVSSLESIHTMMQKELEGMPPEQREMMEEMMKRMKPEINITKKGKGEKILGYSTVIYEIRTKMGGPMRTEYKTLEYVAPDLKFVPSEISKEDAQKIAKKFEKIRERVEFSRFGEMEEGFVLKSISYGEGGEVIHKSEAISIKKGDIPDVLLKVPPGYKKEKAFIGK